MNTDQKILALLFALNIPLFFAMGRWYFGNLLGFWKSAQYLFIPDLVSLCRGQFWKDYRSERRVGIYFIVCLLIYLIEASIIREILDAWTEY
jgi:hypothetical protein